MSKIEITPESVAVAYEKTGLKPARGVFADVRMYNDDSQECVCCGLSALLIANNLATFEEIHRTELVSPIMNNYVSALLGVDKYFVESFISGFDSMINHIPNHHEAYELGKACAAKVFNPTSN